MPDLTTSQLADRLGVTKRRALELLQSGDVTGRKLANGIWLADSDSVLRHEATAVRGSGRTLDPETAWGLLWELSGSKATWLTPSTRARVRRRIRDTEVSAIASAVSKRTRASHYTAANVERAATDLIATGRAAAHLIDTDLIEDRRHVCGYVRSGSVQDYAKNHFMIEKANGRDVLYENTVPVEVPQTAMPAAVIAADLAVSTDTRERSAGLRALDVMRKRWLLDH